jgi:hypothetical protein
MPELLLLLVVSGAAATAVVLLLLLCYLQDRLTPCCQAHDWLVPLAASI